jgi:hypothetical protein
MFGDFVAQVSASTGTGQYSLGSTFGSTVTWRSEFANEDVVGYLATTQDATKREVGWGVFTIGTPDKLTRNIVRSTQANGPVDWGSAEVYRIFSVPLDFVLSAMVNGGLGDELADWAPPGFGRLDDTDTSFWAKLRHLGEGEESEEGRHYLTPGVFAASPRRLCVDHGASAHAATRADIGKVHLFNVTSSDRVLTLPASAGMGHGFAMRGSGRLSVKCAFSRRPASAAMLLLCALSTAACGTDPTLAVVALPPPDRLLKPCDRPADRPDQGDDSDLAAWEAETWQRGHDCADQGR